MKNNIPKITVLMPVYNGEKYLKDAIESILEQTFDDFEFLIINDGSTDGSENIISEYTDSRIKYIKNEQNLGLIATLNKGFDLAQGEYIARMDQDDISLPQRFEKQVTFLDNNAGVGVCGAWIKFIGGTHTIIKNPVLHKELQCSLLFLNPIAHPTVMIRKEMFNKNELRYDENFKNAEDFELWSRSSFLFEVRNVPEVLLNYRISKGGITHKYAEGLKQTVYKIFERSLAKLQIIGNAEILELHRLIGNEHPFADLDDIKNARIYLEKLYLQNQKLKIFPSWEFKLMIFDYWLKICSRFTGGFFKSLNLYRQSGLLGKGNEFRYVYCIFIGKIKNSIVTFVRNHI